MPFLGRSICFEVSYVFCSMSWLVVMSFCTINIGTMIMYMTLQCSRSPHNFVKFDLHRFILVMFSLSPFSLYIVIPTLPPVTRPEFVTELPYTTNMNAINPKMVTGGGGRTASGRRRPSATNVPCVDKKCKNGIVRGTDCSCACIVGYEGGECQC